MTWGMGAGGTQKRGFVWVALAAWILFTPAAARADTGVPMLVYVWPSAWVLFVPICLIEALIAKRVLRLPLVQCAKLALVANAWSTLVGIPLTWCGMLLVELLAGLGIAVTGARPSGVWSALLSPFVVAWLGPVARAWHVYTAAALLCIPFCFVSIRVERWSAAKQVPLAAARRWANIANLATYVPLVVALAAFAAFSWHEER
jgi:hypothetical protein